MLVDEKILEAVIPSARHEAAHAVLACKGRIRFSYVTIEPDDDSMGHIYTQPLRSIVMKAVANGNFEQVRTRQKIENVLMFRLAGYVMDAMHDGSDPGETAKSDLLAVERLLELILDDPEERAAYLAWLICHTKTILLKPRYSRAIDVIADALLEQTELSSSQVQTLFAAALEAWEEENS